MVQAIPHREVRKSMQFIYGLRFFQITFDLIFICFTVQVFTNVLFETSAKIST